jgi:hypothetical protein
MLESIVLFIAGFAVGFAFGWGILKSKMEKIHVKIK